MEGRNEDGNVLSTEPRPTRRILHRSSFYPSFYTAERSNRRRDWRSGRQTARASESKINCTIYRLLPMGTGFSRGLSRHDETLSKPRDRHHSGGRQRPRDSPISPAIVVSTIYHGCVNCTARAIPLIERLSTRTRPRFRSMENWTILRSIHFCPFYFYFNFRPNNSL